MAFRGRSHQTEIFQPKTTDRTPMVSQSFASLASFAVKDLAVTTSRPREEGLDRLPSLIPSERWRRTARAPP